jgi:hypothetical protein
MHDVSTSGNVNSDCLVNQSENIESGNKVSKNRTNAKSNLEEEAEERKMMSEKKFPVGKLGRTVRLRPGEEFRTRRAGSCYTECTRRPVLQPGTAFHPKPVDHLL